MAVELPKDVIDQLCEALEEVDAEVTFDPRRNITLCCACKARAPLGTAWRTRAPGYPEEACRRLCERCAEVKFRPSTGELAIVRAPRKDTERTRTSPDGPIHFAYVEHVYSVYVVECSDGTLYTGISHDVPARIEAHNAGKGAKYTRGRGPVTLVYEEPAGTRSDASKRELAVKRLSRAKKLALCDTQSFDHRDSRWYEGM